MKIFTQKNEPPFACENWNFVDQNNVFVGWTIKDGDTTGGCDVTYSWHLLDADGGVIARVDSHDFYEESSQEFIDKANAILEPYVFDPASGVITKDQEGCDMNNSVVFTLVAEGKPSLYLHLMSDHNGYYAQGFSLQQGETWFLHDIL